MEEYASREKALWSDEPLTLLVAKRKKIVLSYIIEIKLREMKQDGKSHVCEL